MASSAGTSGGTDFSSRRAEKDCSSHGISRRSRSWSSANCNQGEYFCGGDPGRREPSVGVAGHYALCERDDWMSPQELMDLVRLVRTIAFDPCSPMCRGDWHADFGCNGEGSVFPDGVDMPPGGNGLMAPWAELAAFVGGLIYVNPPYGGRKRIIDAWIDKCGREAGLGAEIVGCVPASTGANWFRGIWGTAQAVCFPYGRLSFVKPDVVRPAAQLRLFDAGEDVKADEDNSATFWSAVPYWGHDVERFYEAFDGYGHVVEPRRSGGEAERVLGRIATLIAEVDQDLVRRLVPEQG